MTRVAKGGGRESEKRSPAMQQFFQAKEQYPDALLFFRMGDFYELFYEDAIVASKALDLTLTSRSKTSDGNEVPMAGVPHHAASSYLARLVEKGFRVAICEQMADPATCKGVVPREVVRVVTPGLALDPDTLAERADNWLVVAVVDGDDVGVASIELSRACARVIRLRSEAELFAELVRCEAREILLTGVSPATEEAIRGSFARARIAPAPPPDVSAEGAIDAAAWGRLAPIEADALRRALGYAQAAHPRATIRVDVFEHAFATATLGLDEPAIRNLELVRTLAGERDGALLHAIDRTKTSMGARLLRRRIVQPLVDVAQIRRRLDAVQRLVEDEPLRRSIRAELARVGDLERLVTRAELGLGGPRELGGVRDALRSTRELALRILEAAIHEQALGGAALTPPVSRGEGVLARLDASLEDELPLVASQGGIVRAGADERIDALRHRAENQRDVLLALEARERDNSGIASLKVGFTRVFGYYIEVTRANLRNVPPHFRRKQTIANGERFTTDELVELETSILGAEDKLRALELEVFEALRTAVGAAAEELRKVAAWLAELDVTAALAELACQQGYVRPEVDDGQVLELVASRHAVVEQALTPGAFVPNDVTLDADGARLWVITGPNMAGKSTVMRQVALVVVLAQMGSYVPCTRARVGLVDRIYTRVGASDNLARGQSTFMVEMAETAALLRGASTRSLVVLDEIGRGTSTYDGLSIARAVAEHLVDHVRCRALFATHYHELCALHDERPRNVRNFNVSAREHAGDIVFLHQLVAGGANRSYGVAVARLAGLPESVIVRARELLVGHEAAGATASSKQLPLFASTATTGAQSVPTVSDEERAVLDELRAIRLETMTPLDAFQALLALSKRASTR